MLKSLRLKDAFTAPDTYPYTLPCIGKEFALQIPTSVTFFVGENGAGKSTVLEAIAIASGFNPAGGTKNSMFTHHVSESSLAKALVLSWSKKHLTGYYLRAESFYNYASYLEKEQVEQPQFDWFAEYGGKSLHSMSHGESFLTAMNHRFKKGIFLLDEPEAALSPKRQLSLLSLLHQAVCKGESQFIIATHSPILLAYPGATIYLFNQDGIQQVDYKDTEHYRVTKDFLDAPEVFLRHLGINAF